MIYSQHKYPFDTKFVGFWWIMFYCRKIFVKTYALFPQFFCDWKADFGNFFDFRIIASASKGLFHLSVDQNKLNFSMLLFSKGWIPGREVSLSILYSDRRLNITDCTQILPRITVTYVITTRYLGPQDTLEVMYVSEWVDLLWLEWCGDTDPYDDHKYHDDQDDHDYQWPWRDENG